MKKAKNIIRTFIGITLVGFLTYLVIALPNGQNKQEPDSRKSQIQRVMFSFRLDTIDYSVFVPYQKRELILNKTETDSTIDFLFVDPTDSLNFGSAIYSKKDKSISMVGHKYVMIESHKYENKNISSIPFDLYDFEESVIDGNGPFFFNNEYGILNSDVLSEGLQLFYIPKDLEIDIKNELLR